MTPAEPTTQQASQPTWREHLRVITQAAGHYISRMALGLGVGALLWLAGATLGIVLAYSATPWLRPGAGGVHAGGVAAIWGIAILQHYWRVCVAVLVLGIAVPVGYFITTQGAAIKGAVSLVLSSRPEVLAWAIGKVLAQVERVIPDFWARSVNVDHKMVQKAYSALDSESMPRVGAFLLRFALRKVDFPTLLELEMRSRSERYSSDEVRAALNRRVIAAVHDIFRPDWRPWFAVLGVQVACLIWFVWMVFLKG